MALRAFHANPLGGFGSESTPASIQDGDALCQIVKELVDNAVDACCQSSSSNVHQWVRVEINKIDQNTLQVTVTDNGAGMANIQQCVNLFKTSKGNHETAGRYGIGLTLCLLHAQRLGVPKLYACITSATKNCSYITRELFIVDTEGDNDVKCRKHEKIGKTNEEESGTCVSVLVPVSQKMRKTGVVR